MLESGFQASTCLTRRGGWKRESELKEKVREKEGKVSGVAFSAP
jgi:hypothetical protein